MDEQDVAVDEYSSAFFVVFDVSWIEIDLVVRSSMVDGQSFVMVVICWSWILVRRVSERFSDEISLPLPESGESQDSSCWFDVNILENRLGCKCNWIGRDGRFYSNENSLLKT